MTRDEITERLEILPKGSISRKTVNGKVYFYHRWYENGKRKEKYIPEHDIDNLTKEIQERKNLMKILKSFHDNDDFISDVILGDKLKAFSAPVANLKKRDAFDAIWNYIHGDTDSRVLILYGLRRTGKTTLIRQTINEMSAEELGTTAFIQIMKSTTLSALTELRELVAPFNSPDEDSSAGVVAQATPGKKTAESVAMKTMHKQRSLRRELDNFI